METKGVKRLERELASLRRRFDEDRVFDYARRAETARKATAIVRAASAISRAHPGDEQARIHHHAAVDLFRAAVAVAYAPGFWRAHEFLKAGDPSGLPAALEFLEADPWFFRSGYTKFDVIRAIVRLDLPSPIADRLARVVLAAVDGRDRREFRSYCRLARKVDSPDLRAALSERLLHDDTAVRRRARWALDACEKPGPKA